MAEDATFESDKGIGLAVVLGVLAGVGAVAMGAGPSRVIKAFGFAAAVTLGVLLIVALHVYD